MDRLRRARFHAPLASAGLLGVLLVACGSDGPTSGADEQVAGRAGLAGAKADGGAAPVGGASPSNGGAAGLGGTQGGSTAAGTSGGGARGSAAGSGTCVIPESPLEPTPGQMDVVHGELVQLNDNGAWSTFTDERAVVDVGRGKLIVGSAASGGARSGNIEAVIYDLATKTVGTPTVLGKLGADDHAAPAFLVRPDGNYLGFWSGRNVDCNSYFRVFDGATWAPQASFDWASGGCVASGGTKITFNNPWLLAAEGKIYDFARSADGNQHAIGSSDNGQSWSYAGRLTATPRSGYYKYWGNGVDRIDFVATEGHPRDVDNSLYHGYVSAGKTYDSSGKLLDSELADATAPDITAFTKAYATGSTLGGVTLNHAWNVDVVRYAGGTIAILGVARVEGTGTDSPEHRVLYVRWNGESWTTTALGRTGPKLYASEQDYTGGATLHPDKPHTLYISTTIDPRDDKDLGKHELFQGTSCDQGATWSWIPITQNSTQDNLRPTVPRWDSSHTALLWFRGVYTSAQSYSAAIVGIVEER